MSEFHIDVAAEVCINFYCCNNLFLTGGKFKIFLIYSGSDETSRNCSTVKRKQIHVREYELVYYYLCMCNQQETIEFRLSCRIFTAALALFFNLCNLICIL